MRDGGDIELDARLKGLRAVIGERVGVGHPFNPLIASGTIDWFERRYSALADARFVVGGLRRTSTRKRLLSPRSFRDADAELQVASTLLRDASVRLEAPDEGVTSGERQADYLLAAPRMIDVEVRTLSDPEEEQREDALADRIVRKLSPFVKGSGFSVMFTVREATPSLYGGALDLALTRFRGHPRSVARA